MAFTIWPRQLQNCAFIAGHCCCCGSTVLRASNSISRSDRIVSREHATLVCPRRTLRLHRRVRVFRIAPHSKPVLPHNPQHLSLELDGLYAVPMWGRSMGNCPVALGEASCVVVGDYDLGGVEFPLFLPQYSRRCAINDGIGGCLSLPVATLDKNPAMDMPFPVPADAATAFYFCFSHSPPQRTHHHILVVGPVSRSLHGLASGGFESRVGSADARSRGGKSGNVECLMRSVHECDQQFTFLYHNATRIDGAN